MYIVCIFGDTRAGHVYNIVSRAINHGHNHGQDISQEDIRSWDAEAQLVVDEMAAYLVPPLEEDIVHPDVGLVEATTDSLVSIGLEATVRNNIKELQWRGSPAGEITFVLHDSDLLPNLLDVLGNGQRRYMVPEFIPTVGRVPVKPRHTEKALQLATPL
jgi:hypothetical protein